MALDPSKDVMITVRGGCVTGAYAPADARVFVVDFDNLEAGDTTDLDDPGDWNEGPIDSKDAVDAIENAREVMKKNKKNGEDNEA